MTESGTSPLSIDGSELTDAGDLILERAMQIRAAARFPEAVKAFTDRMVEFRLNGPRHINKLFGQDARYRMVCFTLYLHYDTTDAGLNQGASYTRLLELTAKTTGGGHRVVETTLDLMLAMGLVTVERGPSDRRLKLYRPTAAMFRMLRVWLEGSLAPLDLIEPHANRVARLHAGDEIMRQFFLGVGRAFRDGEPFTRRLPRFSCFFDREGGWPFLAIAVTQALANSPLPGRGAIASRLGISKSQIAVVSTEATRLGLLRVHDGAVYATPELVSEYEQWVAICLALFATATPA